MDRRKFLATTAGLLGVGLAGCTGSGDQATDVPDTDAPTETLTEASEAPTDANGTPTATGSATSTPSGDDSGGETPYSVSMEPVGEVTFEEAPETWVANNGSWADMGVALGLEPPEGVWLPSRYHTQYYDEIPGVSVDESGMVQLWGDSGVGKEQFYEFEADVHVIDPNFLINRSKGWEQSDIDEISEDVAPFFGNSIFSGGYDWHDDYQYYSLYEAFEKLALAFRRTERYAAFESLHEEFQSNVSDVVPPEGERASVAIFWAGGNEPEEFSPYLVHEGTSFKQWRDLEVRDALANTDVKDFHSSRARVGFETLLEIDPDNILFRGHEAQTREAFRNTVVAYMEDHDLASGLTAVQNGDVYRGGPLYQGPITNLVVTERAAAQVYGVEEELFDRERVAAIVEGEI
mgnify:CR=1 FL=1